MRASLNIKNINIRKLFKHKNKEKIVILMFSVILIYLLSSLYFIDHFFFNTIINEVDVSLKTHADAEQMMKKYIKIYELRLIERNDRTEKITGQEIGMRYNEQNNINRIYHMQKSYEWIKSLFKKQKYYQKELFTYEEELLEKKLDQLNCLNNNTVKPRNVGFRYSNGSYEIVKEVYGNKIIKDKLKKNIKLYILKGKMELDFDENHCYENPDYTLDSEKTHKTKNSLDKYVSANITYIFGDEKEILDGKIISRWIGVDENLEVVLSKAAVKNYIKGLSKKYDTVGITRNFKTSTGKIIEVTGGLYGWKMNQDVETISLLEDIEHGKVLEKEPVYIQKALSRGEDEIGSTYVEINITRQHLWFYKDGKLITRGPVVTGNPGRGNSTVVGTYMLNYKQRGVMLIGPNYQVKVNYWMPFYGNIGIHDALWRRSFGGEIYKRNGTHGCVNAPLYLAKTIFENIEEGIPIICYEE